MTPPAPGTFGTMGRNTFRDFGFRNVDFSAVKNFRFGERVRMQIRGEFFNLFNHPNFAIHSAVKMAGGHNDPSVPGEGGFGCSCATPDRSSFEPGHRIGRKPCGAAGFEVHFLELRRRLGMRWSASSSKKFWSLA